MHVVLVVVEVEVVGQAGQAHRHRVAGAPLDALLDEVEPERGAGRRRLLQLLDDHVGAVADHHHRPVGVDVAEGVEHVLHQGATTEGMEGLGALRAHPSALPRREDDRRQPALDHG